MKKVSTALSLHNNHLSLPLRHPTFLSFLSPVSAKEIANVKKCHPVWQMSASASPVASLPQILSCFFLHSERKTMSSRAAQLHPKAPHPKNKKKILDSSMMRKVLLLAIRLYGIYTDHRQKTEDSLSTHSSSYLTAQ